jgi:hypothetical protein
MLDNPPDVRSSQGRPTVLLIGPKDARRRARAKLTVHRLVEAPVWRDLPPGPAICIDARRFEYLSPGGFDDIAGALVAGAAVVVPASNAGPWPMCGFDSPRGPVGRRELDAHAEQLRTMLDPELEGTITVDGSYPVPAVVGVADASRLTCGPDLVGDLAEYAAEALLLPAVWCHVRERVLLSAAMIVKNESRNIEKAISSVIGFVDEVVVYDTGSTDDTVELARAMGAVVRQGYWDDDFSRARNEACRMTRGEWYLGLDADDRLVGDAEQFASARRLIANLGVRLPIQLKAYNVLNAVTGQLDSGFFSRRFFPSEMRWKNRVHEVAVRPDGQMPLEVVNLDGLTIRHEGYGGDMTARQDRNLRLAQKRLEDRGDDAGAAMDWFELGRAAVGAGDVDIARDALDHAVALAVAGSVEDYCSRLFLVGVRKGQGATVDEMEELLEPVLRGAPAPADAARWVLAGAVNDARRALELLEGVHRVEYMFANASPDAVDALRLYLLLTVGDADLAFEVLQRMEAPTLQSHAWWATSLALMADQDAFVELMVNRLEPADLSQSVIALMSGPVAGAYEVATCLLDRFGPVPALIAYLSSGSQRSGFVPALDARVRLDTMGYLDDGDPLEALYSNELAPPVDRMLAALVLDEVAPAQSSRTCRMAGQIDDDIVPAVLEVVEALLPDLVSEAASALATSPERNATVLRMLELLDA